MSYEVGFAQGEYDAFQDRRAGCARKVIETPSTAEDIGYWDAYSPRSVRWGVMRRSSMPPLRVPMGSGEPGDGREAA